MSVHAMPGQITSYNVHIHYIYSEHWRYKLLDIAISYLHIDTSIPPENQPEAAVEIVPKKGTLDQRSIIIISVALGVIFTLTLVTLICVKRNQEFTPQGYNLEVM